MIFHYFQGIEKLIFRSQKCVIQRKNSKEYGKTLASSKKRLEAYLVEYLAYFKNRTKRFFDKAEKYSLGVLKSQTRNIERISEDQGLIILDAAFYNRIQLGCQSCNRSGSHDGEFGSSKKKNDYSDH
jgi:hypothetical protein